MPRKKEWREGEIAVTFKLTKIVETQTPTMKEWLEAEIPMLSSAEQYNFDNTYKKGIQKIGTWSEEDLKMNRVGGPIYKSNFRIRRAFGRCGFCFIF